MHVRKSVRRRLPHTRKGALIAVIAVFTIGVGTALAAYFLTGGSGSGSATLGTTPAGGQLQLTISFANGLAPGGSEPVDVSVLNPTSSMYQLDGIDETSITTSKPTDCPASWFSFVPNSVTDSIANANDNGQVAAGATWDWNQVENPSTGTAYGPWGTLRFQNIAGTNQNGCSGATVTINASAS